MALILRQAQVGVGLDYPGQLAFSLGGWVYAALGWHAALLVGMLLPALALPVWLHEAAGRAGARQSV
ncbi:hypothetical protein RCH14_002945 [Massilia sp. MP_M2]|uniref:hypothetical protein n=1 Tax=Massilia sp. MP_M2 TaxID=3071713 RepID=UPI00319DB20A